MFTHCRGCLLVITRIILFTFLCIPSAFAAGQSATEDLAFMEVEDVFSAAKHLQEIKDAPASVTVITDDEIRKYGYRTLADILRNVRGFYVTNDRNYQDIGFRGVSRIADAGNLMLELVDGHVMNDNVYGGFYVGNEFGIDIDLIKRVEIVRGPGSTLYGSNALLGVVNVITKDGADIDGLFAKTEGGSYGTIKGGMIYGKKFENGLDLICAGTKLDSQGQDFSHAELGLPGEGRVVGADGESNWAGFVKAKYRELSVTANTVMRDKTVPTANYGTAIGDSRFETTDVRSFLETKWEHAFSPDRQLMIRGYYDHYEYLGDYPYADPFYVNKDETYGQWIGTEVKYFQKVGAAHFLTAGMEATHHLQADQENYNVSPWRLYLDDHRSYTTWSPYGQDEWDITSWLRLVAGLRYDYFTTFGKHLSPKAALIVKPFDPTTFKLLYSQSFRAPNIYELYYTYFAGEGTRSNPDLKPETVDAYEAVWEQELTKTWKGVVDLFHYEISDMITAVTNPTDGTTQFQNLQAATSDGVEIGLEANWRNGFRGEVSYTYQNVVNDKTDEWFTNSPHHLGKIKAIFPLYREKLFFAAQGRFMSDRLTWDGASVEGAAVADVNLYAHDILKKGFDFSIGLYNIFDQEYYDPVSADHRQDAIEQNGRNFWLKASYRF